jgi:N-acetyl-alpha-D-muramate 1-phosphate uridylyltransferase
MNPAVVLLSGGLGTRLAAVARDIPKAMVDVCGKPFIEWQLRMLAREGMRRVVVCAGFRGEQIREYVGTGGAFGVSVEYSFDGPVMLGTAGAVRKALPLLGDEFFVMYGDSYLTVSFGGLRDYFRRAGGEKAGVMTVLKNDNRWDRSNVVFRNDSVLRYDKRNAAPDMHHIDYGLSLLRRSVFESAPEGREYDLAAVFAKLAGERALLGYEVTERFYEIGSPEGLEETRKFIGSGLSDNHDRGAL